VIGELLAQEFGYREALLAAAALAAVAVVPALFLPTEPSRPHPRPGPQTLSALGAPHEPSGPHEPSASSGLHWSRRVRAAVRVPSLNRSALGPGTVMGLGFVGVVAYTAFLPLYTREIGLGGAQFAFLTFAVLIILVRTVGARIPDRFGAFRASAAATVLTAVGLVIMASRPGAAALYAGTVVFAVGVALQYPALFALVVNRVPERERTAAISTFTMFLDVAQGLGGAALGQVAVFGGVRWGFLASAASASVALVVLWTWVRTEPVDQWEGRPVARPPDQAAGHSAGDVAAHAARPSKVSGG
nr:MFS transporter [Micromonospora sp. DSM 115978]